MKSLFATALSACSLGLANPVHAAESPASIRAGLAARNRAIHLHDAWVRDPYIVLAPDGFYYYTGTTQDPSLPVSDATRHNVGLGKESLVGWKMRLWRSQDLVEWEDLGTPFTLKDGIWFQQQPRRFAKVDPAQWRLWAPELHFTGRHWVLVHTSPSPVQGANLALTETPELKGPWRQPMGVKIGKRHDPSLFKDGDGTWWMIWGATEIAPLKPDFSDFAAAPASIGPAGEFSKMGHEGCLMLRIGRTYVLFGTGWSTCQTRKGSYNLYYATAPKITGPYGERKFAGRFLGHGTPFQDKDGRWWCTAFFNANVPPLSREQARGKDLSADAQTINPQGLTIVPIEMKCADQGEVSIRALDPDYASPGPDEAQKFGP